MKRFACFVAAVLLSSTALAQPQSQSQTPARTPDQGPVKAEEFSPVQTIEVGIGQAKLIRLNRLIGDVQTSVNNVVRTSVMGDKYMVSVTGVSPGATDVVIVNQYSEVIYIARVNVSGGLQSDDDPPHIVRTYGWTPTDKKNGGNSLVNIVNGDAKGGGNNNDAPDFVERYCSASGCSLPLSRGTQGAGLDAANPIKER
ncbi:pilus assembly protein N-terminal domain-containing protein [Bradyrhizobium sp. INPA03-11B]|uniref:pilus assembly protein N-terminal domain-containing protein n=1 Tax=Bradyrhizobium sp. INPA03-11B TaxID=418598 RepID=UPI00338F2D61